MKPYNVQKFPFPNLADDVKIKEKVVGVSEESKIRDEYTGQNLEVASHMLAKKDAIIKQDEYTQERIDEIKQQCFEKGWNECEKSHQKILEQEREDSIFSVLSKIETNLLNIQQNLEKDYDNLCKDCVDLSYNIANKLAGKLIDKFPKDVLLDFLEKNLPLLVHSSNIMIKISPKNYDGIKSYIGGMRENLSMKVDLVKDSEINIGDCAIDWENGSIKKDTERLRNDLESVFEKNL